MTSAVQLNPFTQLRAALSYSRKDFARILGISNSYLEKIERGERRPSPGLLDQLAVSFGLSAESMAKRKGAPVSLLIGRGAKNLRAAVDRWQRFADGLLITNEHDLEFFIFPKLLALFQAARRERALGKIPYRHALLLMLRINKWIDDSVEELGLRARLQEVLSDLEKEGRPIKWKGGQTVSSRGRHRFIIPSAFDFETGFEVAASVRGKRRAPKKR